MSFKLDRKLEQDSHFVMDMELCQLRLINNSDYPWFILVPRLPNISEVTDLSDADYAQLGAELKRVLSAMEKIFTPDKLNVASIGNMVPQLHVHAIARYKNDKLFPKPVWGSEFKTYTDAEKNEVIEKMRGLIS